MAERVVTIKLVAEATGVVQGINRAKDAVGELKARTADSARTQREEWNKVGSGLLAVGVATTGLGVAALRTGIQYNTLQQTTRAALSTLLGSAQAANAQMDKLDEFARNSPFSKATFITAQQQMLAFGIEAKKVVPYLDAVQNAVAAAGGSNADIEGIVATMSKIQSSAKITAEDLNEFGGRGVNAAELIGSQMGKTGAQIRQDITSGTVSAQQALDALAAGMTQTYAGAADNVKNTFEGSLDRVSAAWRDFSAELATPLVDPNGGGALVDLLNWAADAMRAFEDLPGPVKGASSALVGVAGAGTLALGSAMLLIPRVLEMRDAFRLLTAEGGMARSAVGAFGKFLTGPYGVALLGAAAVTAVLVSENQKLSAQARELADTLDASTGSITKNSQAWAANELQQQGVLTSAKRLGISAKDMTDAWLGNDAALGRVNERLDKWRKNADFRQDNMFKGWSEDLVAADYALDGSNKVLAEAKTRHDELTEATGGTKDATGAAAEEIAGLGEAATGTQEAVLTLADAISSFGKAQFDVERGAIAFNEAFVALQENLDSGTASLSLTTEEGRATNKALLEGADNTNQYATAVAAMGGSTQEVQGILEAGRQKIIDTRVSLGETTEQAKAYADRLVATPEAIATSVSLNGADQAELILQNLTRTRQATIDVAMNAINGTADIFKSLGGGHARGGVIGYAGGGIIPGYDPVKRDTVLTPMRRGEGVLVPEVVRGLGASTIHRLNAAGNSGGASAVQAQFGAGLQASNFTSAAPQQIVVERTVVEHVPSSVTVKDVNNRLIGTMEVVADGKIDQSLSQQAQAGRKAGH